MFLQKVLRERKILSWERVVDWRDLQLAMVLTQAGSLSAASRELELAPSTISRRIDALEQSLGFELFERQRTG